MTDAEATTFLEVLKSHWPKWELSGEQTLEWVRRLRRYGFQLSKKCLGDFAFSRTKQGLPSPGSIFAAIEAAKLPIEVKPSSEPLLLYEIRKEGRDRGYKFYLSSGRPASQAAVKAEAELKCENMKNMTGDSYVLYYANWEAELERRQNPEPPVNRVLSADDKVRLQCEILDNGPPRTKAWLENYIAHKVKKQKREPVHISEAIAI